VRNRLKGLFPQHNSQTMIEEVEALAFSVKPRLAVIAIPGIEALIRLHYSAARMQLELNHIKSQDC
jgi:hypothetical protein